MQSHIPAEERPIGTGAIVLPERPIPGLGDRLTSEQLKAIAEQARHGGGEMRAEAEAADVSPHEELEVLVQVHGGAAADDGIHPDLPAGELLMTTGCHVLREGAIADAALRGGLLTSISAWT